jgi:Zn-dependent alcohol dehydrogenase
MKIRAAVTRAPKAPASLEELRLEEPRSKEVLVRVVATGVCHTDIAMRDQAYPVPQPIVLGHEGGRGSRIRRKCGYDATTRRSCGSELRFLRRL